MHTAFFYLFVKNDKSLAIIRTGQNKKMPWQETGRAKIRKALKIIRSGLLG